MYRVLSNLFLIARNQKIVKTDSYFLLVSMMFSIGYAVMLFTGRYWDDWMLGFSSFDELMGVFTESGGNQLTAVIHYFFMNVLGESSYKVIVLFVLFTQTFIIKRLLEGLSFIGKGDAALISLLFLFSPFFFTKVYWINVPAIVFGFFFYISWFLLGEFVKNNNNIYKYSSAFFLFLSVVYEGVLAFQAVILCYVGFIELKERKIGFYQYLCKYWIFVLIPLCVFSVKHFYFTPHGSYLGYNQIDVGSHILGGVSNAFLLSVVRPAEQIMQQFLANDFIYIYIVLMFMAYYQLNLVFKSIESSYKISVVSITLSFVLFFLAVLPFVAVGKIPESFHGNDRLQIFLPLPFALAGVYLLKVFSFTSRRLFLFLVSILLVILISLNITMFSVAVRDSQIQQLIINELKVNDVVKENNVFVVDDQINSLNFLSRRKATYEYAGYFREAFGDETRFGIDYLWYLKNKKNIQVWKDSFSYKTYNYSNAPFIAPTHKIRITLNNFNYNSLGILKVQYYLSTDDERISEIIDLKVSKL